jgi:glycosyltransferase involved in cell wall biosynthesis
VISIPVPQKQAAHTASEDVEELAERAARESLRLACFAPVPPVPSGIGDYLIDLVPWLPEPWSIDLFIDDGVVPEQELLAGRARCYPHGDWRQRHAETPYDLNIYQVGNNRAHAYTLPYVLEHPGLLVLHDAVVHPARALHAVETGDIAAYRAAAESCRPDVGRALGHMIAGGLASPELFFRFPLSEDLVRSSLVTCVHGTGLVEWLRAMMPTGRVVPLAHWRSVPETTPELISGWRKRLGGDGGTVIAGCFGNIDVARRLDRVIQAVADLRSEAPVTMVVAGAVDPSLELPERASAAGVADRVHWLGRVSAADFGALMQSVDFAVNLRFPPARASSGVLHQLLQAGVPAIISDLVHWMEYPAAAVQRVPPGPDSTELATLRDSIRLWATRPELREEASRTAHRWAQVHLGPEQMANSYTRAVGLALEQAAR